MDQKQAELEDFKLSQEMNQKEQQADQLKVEQQKVQKTFENIQVDLHRGHQELSHLNQEMVHFGGTIHLIAQQEEQARSIRSRLNDLADEFNQQYTKQVKIIDREADDLYQKRRQLTWD